MSPQRWKLTLAYEGDNFSGWQSQPDQTGVQDVLEKALAQLAGRPLRIHGAGRTDAGVHALGQCAHLDAPPQLGQLTAANWRDALNVRLPASVRILHAEKVSGEFHARFSATGKLYRYRIASAPTLPPTQARVCWHRRHPPDPAELRWRASWLIGHHDFRRLCANRGCRFKPADTRRHLRSLHVNLAEDNEIRIEILGDGFLYKMVRMIVGSLVAVAEGKRPASWLLGLIERPRSGDSSPFCAPAHGLSLVSIDYGS